PSNSLFCFNFHALHRLGYSTYAQIVALNRRPFIHSKTGEAFNLQGTLPQDLKSIETFTGLGGPPHTCREMCPFCSQWGDFRGMKNLRGRCAKCLENDLRFPHLRKHECRHSEFIGVAPHVHVLYVFIYVLNVLYVLYVCLYYVYYKYHIEVWELAWLNIEVSSICHCHC
ncbi:hypothetical protein B484DRAFT_32304, partial [Ochromonadaceae sp. CCMP2298]